MQIGGYEFSYGSLIDARRKPDGVLELDYPSVRYDNVKNLRLHKYGSGPFVFLRLAPLPTEPGVYAIVEGDRVLYVGKASVTIQVRWQLGYQSIQPRNCFQGGQSTNCRVNNLIHDALAASRHIDLYLLATPNYVEVEDELIALVQPPWNK